MRLRRNVWGGAFHNRSVAANEATKHIKIKIRHDLKWLQNVVKNATIKKTELPRWKGDGMRQEHNRGHRRSKI